MAKSPDLDTLLKEGKRVFIENTSNPKGYIVLTFVDGSGKPISRPIPRTWIPICLTDTLSPDVIYQCNDLRLLISKGILRLVDPDEATKKLESPAAQEELTRLNTSDFSNSAVETARVLKLQADRSYATSLNNPNSPVQDIIQDPVSNRVKSTLLRVESKDITERDAVADLRIIQDQLTHHDLTYIIAQVKEEGILRRFAYTQLSELSAKVDADIISNEGEEEEDPALVAAARAQQKLDV